MLEYRRYRDAAAHLSEPVRRRRAATSTARRRCRPSCGGSRSRRRRPSTSPSGSARRSATCCASPPEPDISHIRPTVSLERRLRGAARRCSRAAASFDFDEEFGDEDRLTQAVTLFALLELHREGEATWEQKEPFGPIEIRRRDERDERPRADRRGAALPLAAAGRRPPSWPRRARRARRQVDRGDRRCSRGPRRGRARGRPARGRRRLHPRQRPRRPRTRRGACWPSRGRRR